MAHAAGRAQRIEPMAARLHPERVQSARQSLHHLVTEVPWSDEAALAEARRCVLRRIQQPGADRGLDR